VEGAVRADEPPGLGERQPHPAKQHEPAALAEDPQRLDLVSAARLALVPRHRSTRYPPFGNVGRPL